MEKTRSSGVLLGFLPLLLGASLLGLYLYLRVTPPYVEPATPHSPETLSIPEIVCYCSPWMLRYGLPIGGSVLVMVGLAILAVRPRRPRRYPVD